MSFNDLSEFHWFNESMKTKIIQEEWHFLFKTNYLAQATCEHMMPVSNTPRTNAAEAKCENITPVSNTPRTNAAEASCENMMPEEDLPKTKKSRRSEMRNHEAGDGHSVNKEVHPVGRRSYLREQHDAGDENTPITKRSNQFGGDKHFEKEKSGEAHFEKENAGEENSENETTREEHSETKRFTQLDGLKRRDYQLDRLNKSRLIVRLKTESDHG